ncbi:MAG: hypothetical protein FD189_1226 [Elusimicrobia bacterium]|nr:MAG: hypothetical protein FD154_1621 [Elusimicrobiota bacterium]KAF0155860.1 MAG: hypothetical protein FD189_1226 [Elusimicrobiota bacterium]
MQRRARNSALKVLLAGSALCFLYAWQGVEATRTGYEIEKLRGEMRNIEHSNDYLRKDISIALSPASLEAKAQKLGMAYPEPDRVVQLGPQRGESSQPFRLARFFRRGNGRSM